MKKIYSLIIAIIVVLLVIVAILAKSTSKKTQTVHITPTPLPNKPASFILTADVGTGNENQKAVARSIQKYCEIKDCEAVFIAGDVIYDSGVKTADDKQFKTKFEQIYQYINLPFYIAFGNHDYLGCEECYLEYAKTSTKWKMPAPYYIQPFDNVTFFVINTEEFDTKQQDWLKKSIRDSNAKWKIVVGHRPIITYDTTHHNVPFTGRDELLSIMCNQVDFYVAGHAHLMEDVGQFSNCKTRQLVSGGGGAYVRPVLENHQDEFVHVGYGFIAVEVPKKNMNGDISYKFINTKGEILHPSFETMQ